MMFQSLGNGFVQVDETLCVWCSDDNYYIRFSDFVKEYPLQISIIPIIKY